jgi:hypothetical protein
MMLMNPLLNHKRASKKRLKKGGVVPAKAKRGVGRPTLYRPEFCQMLVIFFDIPLERDVVFEVENGQGGTFKETRIVVNTFPTFAKFAACIGVSSDTLRKWAKAKNPDGTPVRPEFFWSYARAHDLQEALLIEGGMSGAYNYKFAILAARNILGWRAHVEQDGEVRMHGATVEKLRHIYEEGMRRAKEGSKKTIDSSLEL